MSALRVPRAAIYRSLSGPHGPRGVAGSRRCVSKGIPWGYSRVLHRGAQSRPRRGTAWGTQGCSGVLKGT